MVGLAIKQKKKKMKERLRLAHFFFYWLIYVAIKLNFIPNLILLKLVML